VRRAAWLLALSLLTAASRPAAAEPSPSASPAPSSSQSRPRLISPARRTAAIAAAVVPGFVIHGLGSWIARDRRTAKRLAVVEGGGLAALLAGGLPLFLTYASRRVATPAIPVTLTGAAVFTTSWLADIWSAAGAAAIAGHPRARAPWQVDAGVVWTPDPLFEANTYGRIAGAVALGRLRLAPSMLVAAEDTSQRYGLDAAWRLLGSPATGAGIADGSRVELRAGLSAHLHAEDNFWLYTPTAALHGRLDGAALAPGLAGAFAEGELGLGLEVTDHDAVQAETIDLLVGRFGFGAYLGDGRGEWSVWYNHRRDGLAGGFVAGRAAGFLGSVGTSADVIVHGPWSATAELELGSNWVASLGVRFRGGTP
jgi:hypothetical protein